MPTQAKNQIRPELILLIIALVCAVMLAVMVVVCLPYMKSEAATLSEDPEDAIRRSEPPGQTVPLADPTNPTLPPPEPNRYDRFDFQYDGAFLKLIYEDCKVGIDVSSHQQTIDWPKVAQSGVELVMVRAGYRGYGKTGKLVEDERARWNMANARAAGLEVGAYFFSQAITVEEAQEEARMLLGILQGQDITLPVVYDWEYISTEARTANVDARTLTDCAIAFCTIVEEAGYTPMVYFNKYQSNHLMYLAELKQYQFWLAWYSDRMDFPYRLRMWQYSDKGTVPGITTDVDLNVWFPDR